MKNLNFVLLIILYFMHALERELPARAADTAMADQGDRLRILFI